MSQRLSITFEQLVTRAMAVSDAHAPVHEVDVLVVGSGYGAALAAARLAGANTSDGKLLTLTLLERGREYRPGDFPEDVGMAPRHVRIQPDPGPDGTPSVTGYEEGLFDLRGGEGVGLLVGNGLGGGSLINASVAEMPDPEHLASLPLPAAWRNYFRHQDFLGDQAEVERLLGVVAPVAPPDERKYAALQRLGQAVGGEAVPARLTVRFDAGVNAVGVHQDTCLRCGNCVTGCNVGAKSSLDHTLLSLAAARDATLVTGATVVSVRPNEAVTGRRWIVKVRRTRASRVENGLNDGPELWEVAADHVILGAGSLGSTEILMRSRDMEGLSLSSTLGHRFSTNGDGIATGFAQRDPVSPIGTPTQTAPAAVGPTIRGILRMRLDEDGKPVARGGTPVAIEDGAVPHALRYLFGEAVVTAGLFNRLANGDLPARLKVPRSDGTLPDPLACSSDVIKHSQLLLLMGDDRARGRLVLRGKGARAVVVPAWPDAAQNPALVRIDKCLAEQNLKAGFDGGQYVPNPGWRLLPEEAGGVMSGALPGGMTVSVHPLGGCAAADSAAEGVVDEAGRVFSGAGSAVHAGLYVMDGAVLPGATAVNPFLMISVMAWRAAGRLLATEGWTGSTVNRVGDALSTRGRNPVARETPAPVALEFSERLSGDLSREPAWVRNALCGDGRSTLHLRSTLSVADLDAWLEAPGETPLSGQAELVWIDPQTGAEQVLPGWSGGRCEVRLLARERLSGPALAWQALEAYHTYQRRRERGNPYDRKLQDLMKEARGFIAVAFMHAQARTMQYRFTWPVAGRSLDIVGVKRLAYRTGNRPVFEAMTVLDASFVLKTRTPAGVPPAGLQVHKSEHFELRVDLLDMARDHPPRITAMPHLPAAIQSVARVGAFAARCILQTSFWEFGLDPIKPEQGDRLREPDPAPQPVFDAEGVPTLPTAHAITVPVQSGRAPHFALRLLHYAQPEGGDPVVLLHGLAQGSRIFTTALDENMASAMWRAGFDVWLVDYRLSNLVLPALPDHDWDMDDIAEHDIPAALGFVHAHYRGQRPLRVFAHCVGATTLTMGLLANRLSTLNVSHVAMNAIHPWVMPALANNLRARLAGFLRERLPGALLEPRPSGRPGLAGDVFDRLAMALARYHEARTDGMAPDEICTDHPHHDVDASRRIERLICDRMTVLYGRMWTHGNLDPRTHRDFREMIGAAPPGVYRQLYHLNRRERVTDRHGENAYLTAANLRMHWTAHTLLLHGEDSEVFDPQSARRSAAGLQQFLPAGREVRLKCVPGFGHMDVVFARQARDEVYPHIVDFFRDPTTRRNFNDVRPQDAPPESNVIQTGPFIRGTRRSGDCVVLLCWLEMNPYHTRSNRGLSLNQGQLQAHVRTAGNRRYHWIEVVLPARPQPSLTLSFPPLESGGSHNRNWRTPYWHPQGRYEVMGGDRFSDFVGSVPLTGTTGPEDPTMQCSLDALTDKPWFRRLAEGGDGHFRFLAGSCRYPAQFMDARLADEVYAGMLTHVERKDGVDLVFLLGDQIYADATAGLVDSDDPDERYIERYRTAFGSPYFARLCGSVPVHFAVDDHEVDDQWSGEPLPHSQGARHAIDIALDYQLRFPQPQAGNGLAYALPHPDEVACPVFVMDARFEREYRDGRNPGAARMIGARQQALLDDWLQQAQASAFDSPKFIVSSVVLAPFERRLIDRAGRIDLSDGTSWTEDGWGGYPATLAWLIRRIVELEVEKVVFVGGDQHLSSVSALTLRAGERSIEAWHVVASGLYAPLPLASLQREEVVTAARVKIERGVSLDYTTTLLGHDYRHFVRVDAYRQDGCWWLDVRTCDAAGQVTHAHPPIPL